MVKARIPVLLLSFDTVRRLGRRMSGLGKVLTKIMPSLATNLPKLEIDIEPEAYAVGSLVSSFIYGAVFSLIVVVAFLAGESDPENIGNFALGTGIGIWFVFFIMHLIYPSIVVKKVAAQESKDLLFALRELMVDVNSGIPLFWAMNNTANAGYGQVSDDFRLVVQEIESGVSERDALRNLAIKTESEHLKRALWQMVNAIESGATMKGALAGIVDSVEKYTYRTIKNYSSNLSFLMLIYMFAAAVVPSLGVTFLVLLSAFSDFGVSVSTVSTLVVGSAMMQLVLIGYMSATRPSIFGG
ncbi:type II secretion system F family protein [Candidatus Micrarchaeota archaeon]|nr:type II secretion system F family protein [Candidatus Micrarchaeota archaeon]MBU1166286.1 type II secretion system F family protein [Candidatus Micrarchaeota archaeon]MBU1886267.1 type II secretion system F family protein [Candidatus Micrarchaeota archaeon]